MSFAPSVRRALIAAPYLRVLRKAVDLSGGESALAAALGVAPERLTSWLAGEVVPPVDFYLLAMKIVERATARPPARVGQA